MSTNKDRMVAKRGKLLMRDNDKTLVGESLNFRIVVDDIAQAIERRSLTKLLFCRSNGFDDAKTKASIMVDNNVQE